MKVFRCLSIAGILFLTAMSVGQTRPIHPPADYVDPGINSPPATGQTPKPEFPDVAIYRRNAEPVAGEPFHLVLEIRNMTAADISLAQLVFAEIKSDDGKIYPTGPVIPADSGEKLIAVLRNPLPPDPLRAPMTNQNAYQ